MSKTFSKDYTITCYEADANQLMRPTAMLDLMQEAANVNASTLGFGYDEMMNSNIAWVLSRIHVKFNSTPRWRDEVNLKTWHKGVSKLFYLRDFILSDKEGNPMVLATTSWLIIDMNTRRLVRNSDLALSDTAMHAIETRRRGDAGRCGKDFTRAPRDRRGHCVLHHRKSIGQTEFQRETGILTYR